MSDDPHGMGLVAIMAVAIDIVGCIILVSV
jgi:hypothetical protein